MIVHKIDVATGNFIEDCQFENLPVLENGQPDPQYVEEALQQGLYLPRWTGTEWVEDGTVPEPVVPEPSDSERIDSLEIALLEMLIM